MLWAKAECFYARIVFTARYYADRGIAMASRLSARPSVRDVEVWDIVIT